MAVAAGGATVAINLGVSGVSDVHGMSLDDRPAGEGGSANELGQHAVSNNEGRRTSANQPVGT